MPESSTCSCATHPSLLYPVGPDRSPLIVQHNWHFIHPPCRSCLCLCCLMLEEVSLDNSPLWPTRPLFCIPFSHSNAARYVSMVTVHWYKATKETHNTAVSLLDEAPIRREMDNLKQLVQVSNSFGKALRVAESNTISNSGRINVSNVFAGEGRPGWANCPRIGACMLYFSRTAPAWLQYPSKAWWAKHGGLKVRASSHASATSPLIQPC